MFRLIRRLFKWALYLLLVVAALVVAGILLLNTIVKQIVQSRLRSETGMDVQIGKIDIGLSTPTIAIEDVKIYNTPGFGGSLFLSAPEIYVDYDRDAIRAGRLHLNLLRINLAELDIIKDKKGRLNTDGLEETGKAATAAVEKRSPGFAFAGIDTLNVSFQKMRIAGPDNLRPEEVDFGLTNQIFHNLKTDDDWQGMALVLAGRGSATSAPATGPGVDLQKLLKRVLH